MPNRSKIRTAVIPASGFGTRMLPATKSIPKELLPVAGKPLIQYAVEEAATSGVETVVIVVRNEKSLIRSYFASDPVVEEFLERRHLESEMQLLRELPRIADIQYVLQERPSGLAHAIQCARPKLGHEPFVVLLPDVIMLSDVPVTRQLIDAHHELGGSLVAVREVSPQDVERHGIVKFVDQPKFEVGGTVRAVGLVEKPSPAEAPSRLGVFGRYLLESDIWDAIARTLPDESGEVQLTAALDLLCQSSLLYGFCFKGRHFDAGDRLGYLTANIELSLRDPRLQDPLRQYLSILRS
jgi:UTP--glucose-1-phosphate uridylyltransferase